MSKGIGGTSSSQRVSAEPKLADRDGVGSLTCGLMPTGDDLDSSDSVDDRPLSAAKLSVRSQHTIGILMTPFFKILTTTATKSQIKLCCKISTNLIRFMWIS